APDTVEPASDAWHGARHPVWLRSDREAQAPVLVYPPEDTSKPAPFVVFLHGMCGHPENECPWFAGAPTSSRYLVCPRADLPCAGGGSIWSGSTRTRAALLKGMRGRMERSYGDRLGAEATLMGFSLGALVALAVGV